jgi:hypothetical protein
MVVRTTAQIPGREDLLWIPGQGDGDSEMIVMGIPK